MLLNRQPAGVKTPVNNPAESVRLFFANRLPVIPEPSELDTPQPLAVVDALRVVRLLSSLNGRHVCENVNPFAEFIPGIQYREQCQNGLIWNRQQETAGSEFNAVCVGLPIV